MNEKELQEFLAAVGKRYLRLQRTTEVFATERTKLVRDEVETLSSAARLAWVVAERPANTALYQPLGDELRRVHFKSIVQAFDETGVMDALDDHCVLILRSLTPQAIPPEDIQFLRDSGVNEPEAELVILCQQLNSGIGLFPQQQPIRASRVLAEAERLIAQAALDLQTPQAGPAVVPVVPPKRRRYFNGIGKILSGAIAGAGNLLVGVGAIPVTGGMSAAAVIASAAVSIGAISQGIGDLLSE